MNELAGPIPGTLVTAGAADELDREFESRLADSSTLAFRVAYSVLRHRQDAEDVAQEAFVRAHREFHQLRDREKFRGWLARMTWRMALDHRRSQKRREVREDQAARPDEVASHEQNVLAAERSKRLWEAIDALPERLRLVVVLASIEEHSVRDVAAMTGAPEGTVKSRLFEARQKLQELLR
ncbi:MAG TPA: RNA polymerase sigma factor [Vicinamibacterales bacterium]|nr:RNA polymerase sigma factor [Vicinamibacterales bacterium]